MTELTNRQLTKLKGMGQLLEPVLRVGHAGLSEAFLASLNQGLNDHELVKVKFSDFKDQKKELAPKLAELTGSHLIMRVGNVVVLYRQQSDPAKQKIKFDA
jgi:RNA-binding protein